MIHLGECSSSYPFADFDVEIGILDVAKKFRRREQAAFWMPPADKSLGTNQCFRAQVNLGLVVQLKLAMLQPVMDAFHEFVLVTSMLLQRRIVNVESILARLLGYIHGLVSVAQQGIWIFIVQRIDTDSDAGAYRYGLVFEGDRMCYSRDQAFKSCLALFTFFLPQKKHHELVSAQTGYRVTATYSVLDTSGYFDQHLVARLVSHCVVDGFETVEIEIADSHDILFTRRLGEMDGKAKETMGAALRSSKDPAVVQSAFEMPPAQRATIQKAINETYSEEVHIRFEAAPDRICGIELTADGQKIGWSIAEYLTSLDRKVGALLNEPKPAETGPAVK